MYVTFKNNSTDSKMMITVENRNFTINPENSIDVFFANDKLIFEAQSSGFDELTQLINEMDSEVDSYSFKDKILAKLTKKLAEKIPEAILDITIKYEITFTDYQNAIVNMYDGIYSVCDGKFADIFDLMPIGIMFSRAEPAGEINVLDAVATNRKKFLKLMRKILLFYHWGFILPDLFFFIPEYSAVKFFSSHFYIKRLFSSLYNKTVDERTSVLSEKEKNHKNRKNKTS